ncbi:MAG: TlpA disulfide reductase family protein [Thiobacillaceae bacterium]
MTKKKLVLYVLGGLFALFVGAWVATRFYAPATTQTQAPPDLWATSLPDRYGHNQALSQWRGKTLVINFWATWCPPCREEIPDFIALRAKYAPRNVEFIGIAIDTATPVADYANEMQMTYPILIGEGSAHGLARRMGNPTGGLPFTIVVDPAGKIVLRHLGRLSREALDAALARIASHRMALHRSASHRIASRQRTSVNI